MSKLQIFPIPNSRPRQDLWSVWLLIIFGLTSGLSSFSQPAHAATQLFRCAGEDGSILITSKNGAGCRALDVPPETTRALLHKAPPASLARTPPVSPSGLPRPADLPSSWVPLDSGAGQLLLPASALSTPVLLLSGATRPSPSSIEISPRATASVSPVALAQAIETESKEKKASTGMPLERAPMFRITHPDGHVEYTNIRPVSSRGPLVSILFTYLPSCAACDPNSKVPWRSTSLFTSYPDVIDRAALTFGVDKSLIRAVIHAESSFHDHALSAKGAQGLMQLMPATAKDMGVADAFDPVQNIMGGTKYLAFLLSSFHGDVTRAVAAYNAGPNAVSRFGGVPPYAETQVYVHRVELLRDRYASRGKAQ